jgi:MacB-like periplasmic core domain/FtsX-like permease family
MGFLLQDLRYSVRILLKRPGFTAMVVLVLALGIGVNSAFFSVVNGVLLRPVPWKDPERLVSVWETNLKRGETRSLVSAVNFLDWRDQVKTFEHVAGWRFLYLNLTGLGEAERVQGLEVSPDYFPLLGVKAGLGRTFIPQEEQPGHDKVVVLSHGLWQRRFGSDPNLIQNPSSIMHLMVRTPHDPLRWAAGVRGEVYPVDKDQPVFDVKTMDEVVAESFARPRILTLLLGAFAALALSLAAVGIYGVVSYSVTQRTREIGIRIALGAQQRDILKLILTHCMLLTMTGVLLGLITAFAVTRVMTSLLYKVGATDPMTFASVSLILTAVALVASYLPARKAMAVDPTVALRYE